MKKSLILTAILFVGLLTGCSAERVTNSRTDKNLQNLRESRQDGNEESEGTIKSYILSKAELNSAGMYSKTLQQDIAEYTDDSGAQGEELKITTPNDSIREALCIKLTDFQNNIIREAEAAGVSMTFDGELLNVMIPADKTIDVSDYVNAICISGGLVQQIEKGYAAWSIQVNIVNSDNERITYQTVTNDTIF